MNIGYKFLKPVGVVSAIIFVVDVVVAVIEIEVPKTKSI